MTTLPNWKLLPLSLVLWVWLWRYYIFDSAPKRWIPLFGLSCFLHCWWEHWFSILIINFNNYPLLGQFLQKTTALWKACFEETNLNLSLNNLKCTVKILPTIPWENPVSLEILTVRLHNESLTRVDCDCGNNEVLRHWQIFRQ